LTTAPRGSGIGLGAPASGVVMVGLSCLLIAACNGAFRFAGADAAPDADVDTTDVQADSDALTVDSGAINDGRDGAVGPPCEIVCEDGRTCVMTGEEGCTVTCKNATCQINLGESGKAICSDGADCTVSCADECSVTCLDTSRCAIQCTGTTPNMPVATALVCGEAD